MLAEEVGPAVIEADKDEAPRPVFGERERDRLRAAGAYFAPVDTAGSETDPGGLDAADVSEVKVPARDAVLAPSVGFRVRDPGLLFVDFPPAVVGRVEGLEAAPESVAVADGEDGPAAALLEVGEAGGLAGCDEDAGAPFVSELDGSPPLVSKPSRLSSPSMISTAFMPASSKATSRDTSKVLPRFWKPPGISSPWRRVSARTLYIADSSVGLRADPGVEVHPSRAVVRATGYRVPCV